MAALLDDFQKFGALSGPKHFRGNFSTEIQLGSLSLAVQPKEKVEFLGGRISGFIPDAPKVSFVSGIDAPPKSDDSNTIKSLMASF